MRVCSVSCSDRWGNGTQSLRANSLLLMDTLRVPKYWKYWFVFIHWVLLSVCPHTHKLFYNLSLLLYFGYRRHTAGYLR